MTTAKRAVITAAGKGTRLAPLTLETPKPLVRVNGVRIIDRAVRGLRANGVEEIYVVVGYLKEKFRCLEEEYPGLRLIENPWYDTCNNISSLYVARDHLEESIILEADNLILDPALLNARFERSGYSCVWFDDNAPEWRITADERGTIVHCAPEGGGSGWRCYGISRWTAESGRRLKRDVEDFFIRQGKRQMYWDEIPLLLYTKEYDMCVTPVPAGSITEIDSLAELAAIDPSYAHYLT